MGVLKAKVNGVWVPVAQGFDPLHQQLSAVSAGGTINAGASGTVVSLTTPIIPAGRQLLVTMTIHVRQTTASAFDINMTWPAGIGIVAHQFGTGVNATGQLVSMSRVVPTTGAALTFRIDVNAWGAQAVLYGAQSNIAITVMPLATAGMSDAPWTAYTPVWGASVTAPNLGTTGTAVGAYTLIGRTVHWRCYFTTGGTGIAIGSGAYNVTLPPTATIGQTGIVGHGICYGGSGFVPLVADNGIAGNKARLLRCDLLNTMFDQTVGPNGAGHVLELAGTYDLV